MCARVRARLLALHAGGLSTWLTARRFCPSLSNMSTAVMNETIVDPASEPKTALTNNEDACAASKRSRDEAVNKENTKNDSASMTKDSATEESPSKKAKDDSPNEAPTGEEPKDESAVEIEPSVADKGSEPAVAEPANADKSPDAAAAEAPEADKDPSAAAAEAPKADKEPDAAAAEAPNADKGPNADKPEPEPERKDDESTVVSDLSNKDKDAKEAVVPEEVKAAA